MSERGGEVSERGGLPAASYRDIYEALLAHYRTVTKWRHETRFGIATGAVLVQNTTWTNVERSLARLDEAGVVEPRALLALDEDELRALIRPSGFMRAKAATLRTIAHWWIDSAVGSGPGAEQPPEPGPVQGAHALGDAQLRADLLALKGIGPETADVLSLYIFERKAFIWDAYGRRLLGALGYPVTGAYESTRRRLGPGFPVDDFTVGELQDFHSLILMGGKDARRRGGWEEYAGVVGL